MSCPLNSNAKLVTTSSKCSRNKFADGKGLIHYQKQITRISTLTDLVYNHLFAFIGSVLYNLKVAKCIIDIHTLK